METYGSLFNEAKNAAHKPGSKLGSKARDGVEILDALTKTGIAFIFVYAVIHAGHVVGFVHGIWRGIVACPKA